MILRLYSNIQSIPKEILDEINLFDIEKISDYFADPFTFNIGIVFNDSGDNILGAGINRLINEFKLVLNPESTNHIKAKVLNTLMNKAISMMQCNELSVSLTLPSNFIESEHYKDILIKHFDFDEDDNITLRKEI